ncbi:MAG: hypothetical protein Q4F02_02430 [Candidatus Saccharibacteria bacterium]|nr:hypothetical protein [Candidatus Saccharibacteria bacterium]
MGVILKKALKLVFADDVSKPLLKLPKRTRPLKKLTERELIQLESEIGATIFGDKPAHVTHRAFFNLDKDTWIWHEEVLGKDGKRQELTTRYEVQEQGILKIQPNYQYSYLEGEELRNFVLAVNEYHERVARQLYHRDPRTGRPV